MSRTLENELYKNRRYICKINSYHYFFAWAEHYWKDIVVKVDSDDNIIDELYEEYVIEVFENLINLPI